MSERVCICVCVCLILSHFVSFCLTFSLFPSMCAFRVLCMRMGGQRHFLVCSHRFVFTTFTRAALAFFLLLITAITSDRGKGGDAQFQIPGRRVSLNVACCKLQTAKCELRAASCEGERAETVAGCVKLCPSK